eukprot:4748672-Pyramimonas_sp.AAC.1
MGRNRWGGAGRGRRCLFPDGALLRVLCAAGGGAASPVYGGTALHGRADRLGTGPAAGAPLGLRLSGGGVPADSGTGGADARGGARAALRRGDACCYNMRRMAKHGPPQLSLGRFSFRSAGSESLKNLSLRFFTGRS